MGQTVHPGRRGSRLALLAVAVLAAGPLLTGCGSSVASATTTLRGVYAATVVHANGASVPAVDGLRLHPGDVVRTGVGGRAELVTDSRVVYVGSQAAVAVTNGAQQVLRHGAVVADAVHGPGLHLEAAGLDVATPSGAAVRVERSVTSRVGALAGTTEVTSSAGRRLEITALHQAMVGGDALPDSTTPLRLTDDDGEARTVPALVRDDETLLGLARGIDSTGRSTVQVVSAAWSGPLSAPRGVGASERLMPAVIAAARPGSGVQQRYAQAVSYRKDGGSWGVVAHLVGVRAASVVDALATFERTQPPGRIGSVAAVLALAGGRTGTGPGAGGGSTTGTNGGNGAPGGGSGSGTGSASGSPSPSPSPSGPVDQLVGTVDKTVGDVLKVLPSPSPTISPTGVLPLPSLPTQPLLPTQH